MRQTGRNRKCTPYCGRGGGRKVALAVLTLAAWMALPVLAQNPPKEEVATATDPYATVPEPPPKNVPPTSETNPSTKGKYKTLERLPDWSGVWHPVHPREPRKEFPPPHTAEAAEQYRQILASEEAGKPISDPTASCFWGGVPALIIDDGFPFEILFSAGRVTILHERESQIRRIYTDGRKHPADLDPTYNGHSIGHWEDDTLVVDTVGLRGDTLIWDLMPHSDAIHVKERYRLTAPDTLETRVTIIDPKTFTKPYEILQINKLRRDWPITEYSCAENNRNPVVNGVTEVTGTDGKLLQ